MPDETRLDRLERAAILRLIHPGKSYSRWAQRLFDGVHKRHLFSQMTVESYRDFG